MSDTSGNELHPLLLQLCTARGLTERAAIDAFLHPSYDTHLHDPALLPDGEKAAARIFDAVTREEKILICADYDCDGIPGAVVMQDFFKKINYPHVAVYIPDRETEGYGLHQRAVEEAVSTGVKRIITIDLGKTAVEQIAYAESRGVSVIVTDLHEPHDPLPQPFAFVNPKRSDSL